MPQHRLYCNTCMRFINNEDVQKQEQNEVPHKDHELVWVRLNISSERWDNDMINAKLKEME